MSVNPGFGGQAFIPRTLDKVARLDALRHDRATPFLIQVDGGVGPANAADLVAAGADVLERHQGFGHGRHFLPPFTLMGDVDRSPNHTTL